jgi:hypothetical protein
MAICEVNMLMNTRRSIDYMSINEILVSKSGLFVGGIEAEIAKLYLTLSYHRSVVTRAVAVTSSKWKLRMIA